MAPLEPPSSLSPSKIAAFRACPLAFRFEFVDKLETAPSYEAFLGTVVHRALERLFWCHGPGDRSRQAAREELLVALDEAFGTEEAAQLALDERQRTALASEAWSLVSNLFALEDPNAVRVVGVELALEADVPLGGPDPAEPLVDQHRPRHVRLRGIIDRLELDRESNLVVTDYKTGRAPSVRHEQERLLGVQCYALLCEAVLRVAPARVQLVYLRDHLVIDANTSRQTRRGAEQRAIATWKAIERACALDDFRPRPSGLCAWCSFQAICPAVGDTPQPVAEAAVEGA
jgi:putative RecB family exonuclease